MSAATPRVRPWRDDAAAAPLCAWPERELAAIGKTLTSALRRWMEDWELSVTATVQVRCAAASDGRPAAESGWLEVGGAIGAAAWLQWEEGQDARMTRSWFGDEVGSSPVISDLVAMCRQDLSHRIAGALRLGPAESGGVLGASAWHRWSGAIVAELPACGLLLLQAGVVRALARSRGVHETAAGVVPLAALRDAVRPAPLQLQVELVGCELGIGDLQALQVGDVVTLRHRTDAPALVRRSDGEVLFVGWLARTRGRKAIELARPSTSV